MALLLEPTPRSCAASSRSWKKQALVVIIISIGDADKLNTFLHANKWMGRDMMFMDNYSFNAYKVAGFGRFDQVNKETVKNLMMTAPELGGFRE
jgi:hypothetical protein